MLCREAKGKAARLCLGGQILMENRDGLCAGFAIHNPISDPEPVMALRQLDEHTDPHCGTRSKTLGADKGCQPCNVKPVPSSTWRRNGSAQFVPGAGFTGLSSFRWMSPRRRRPGGGAKSGI